MEQHPIPQHIASFQFKLFGNLTARQFFTLAIPLSIATLIFFSNLPVIVRIPLTLLFGITGAFAALVPVGGRPFEKWVVAFIRAVFSPTQRIWVKETTLPEFLNVVINPVAKQENVPEAITAQSRDRMLAYLRSLPRENESPLDVKEQMYLVDLNLDSRGAGPGRVPPVIWPTFSRVPKPEIIIGEKAPTIMEQIETPVAWTKTSPTKREIEEDEEFDKQKLVEAVTQPAKKTQELKRAKVMEEAIGEHAKPFVLPGIEDRLNPPKTKPLEIYRPAMTHLAGNANFSIENIFSVKGPHNEVRLMRGVGKTRVRKLHFAPPANFDLSKLPIRGEGRFEISDELAKRFHFEDESPDVVLPNSAQSSVSSVNISIPAMGQEVGRLTPKQAKAAAKKTATATAAVIENKVEANVAPKEDYSKFSTSNTKQVEEAQQVKSQAQIIPLTSTPNVISGLVTDMTGSPIEGAVLVVRDASGIPIRALKTNKLGQFLSATPLGNGTYTIEVESEHVKFAPSSINLVGEIVQPLALQGQSQA